MTKTREMKSRVSLVEDRTGIVLDVSGNFLLHTKHILIVIPGNLILGKQVRIF